MLDACGQKVQESYQLLNVALAEHRPSHVFGMFSGGHDSLATTHLLAQHPAFDAAVHINTGIGIEETREFVRETCEEQGWPLLELHAPVSYDDLVLKYGFPGPPAHRYMYTFLKERCVRQLVREHKTHYHDRIGLVTGVRAAESLRRMGTTSPVQRDGAQLWLAPLINWTKHDIETYLSRHNVRRNPVVETLGMSGECLCGAYAKPDEFERIAAHYPNTARRILDLEKRLAKQGTPQLWHTCPGETPTPSTAELAELDPEAVAILKEREALKAEHWPLCMSCVKRDVT